MTKDEEIENLKAENEWLQKELMEMQIFAHEKQLELNAADDYYAEVEKRLANHIGNIFSGTVH